LDSRAGSGALRMHDAHAFSLILLIIHRQRFPFL